MDSIRVNRSELAGKSKTSVVEGLIRANALNQTGNVDYNENGKLDGVGFERVTDKFVDNFLFGVLVPDYHTEKVKNKRMRKYSFIGSQNRKIREILNANGLEKCVVKAISFHLVEHPQKDMLLNMPDQNKNKDAKIYYEQVFKIACPNIDYAAVMKFLRNVDYNGFGFFLKDVDITLDYAGSFDKYKCIDHLTSFEDFREQGSLENGEEYPRTIIDNDATVGKNCLTWMEEVDGYTTRQKIYNKMVQMLECKSVRSKVGAHWKDWVNQKGTRLAKARDQAKDRGLTRAEVTFYIQQEIPDDKIIDTTLERIVKYIPKENVYSTSYADTWKSYCNTFKHSLVCVDRSKDVGICVYSYNQETGNISGHVVDNWNEKEKWCLDKLTLNGNLPVDIIEVTEVAKVVENGKKDIVVEVCGNRYCKINKDNSTRFTTRLVSKGGVFSDNRESFKGENIKLLENAGFLEHENCIPYLAKSKGGKCNKSDAELRKLDVLDVNLHFLEETKKAKEENFQQRRTEEFKKIEEKTKPLFAELKSQKETLDWIKMCKAKFSGLNITHLAELKQGKYAVIIAKKESTWYGKQYKLLITVEDNPTIVWSNTAIRDKLQEAEDAKTIDVNENFLYHPKEDLGNLNITGQGYTLNGHKIVYCNLSITTKEDEKEGVAKLVEEETANPQIPRENLLSYKEYPNLTTLPIGSVHKVDGWGVVKHYGNDRIIISLDGKLYQAGEHLEENLTQLTISCLVKIEKVRTNSKRHVKYAVCSVYEKGDWTAHLDYKKVKILSQHEIDGETCILDVRTVDVKGQKRKLLLTDRGDGPVVYKLKKSKLEEKIKVGFI